MVNLDDAEAGLGNRSGCDSVLIGHEARNSGFGNSRYPVADLDIRAGKRLSLEPDLNSEPSADRHRKRIIERDDLQFLAEHPLEGALGGGIGKQGLGKFEERTAVFRAGDVELARVDVAFAVERAPVAVVILSGDDCRRYRAAESARPVAAETPQGGRIPELRSGQRGEREPGHEPMLH
jgi:hypothetical protein